MARAQRVPGIHPKRGLRENAQRTIEVRLDEMLSWQRALDDPSLVTDLHNMRIATKRLRYAFEMFEVCFEEADVVLRQLTGIQEDLGAIHDLDVLVELLRGRLRAIDMDTEQQAIAIMGADASIRDKSDRLRKLLYGQARDRTRFGLFGLAADKNAERDRRYIEFQERWGTGGLEALRRQVRQVAGLEHAEPPDAPDLHIETVSAGS